MITRELVSCARADAHSNPKPVLPHVARVYGDEKAPEAAVALWAFLHGITALEAAGVFGERKPATSFEFGLRMWIRAAANS
jgi:Tetracyclin repressor-like, C-terminal domain